MFSQSALHRLSFLTLVILFAACAPSADEQAEPIAAMAAEATVDASPAAQPRVYFIAPADGDTVSSPLVVTFGIDGMAVVPAGQDTPQSGHHHLIIDAALPNLSLPVPKDAHNVHFGDGRTSTELSLQPGEHTLQLLFADFMHIPHDPAIKSAQITITVE